MKSPKRPNRFSTATVTGLVTSTFALSSPFIKAAGIWIQDHSYVVFSDDYMAVLQTGVMGIVTVLFVAWHSDAPDPVDPTVP